MHKRKGIFREMPIVCLQSSTRHVDGTLSRLVIYHHKSARRGDVGKLGVEAYLI